jgi:hypothetical protein
VIAPAYGAAGGTGEHMKPGVKSIKWAALAAAASALALSGCWNPFSPDEGDDPPPPTYYENCDSAWKVIENLEYAYIARDIDLYLSCFRDDFEFHLLQVDWDDYTGDGIDDTWWGLDLEEQFHEAMFPAVVLIELNFGSGVQWHPWSGDPTGESLEGIYSFDLKVYTDLSGPQPEGYRATGQARFICRPDSTGEYYIWQWWDQSET